MISDHSIVGNTSPRAVELRFKYDRAKAKRSEAEEGTTWDPSAPQYSRMEGSCRGSRAEVVARNQSSQAIYQILSTKYCNKRNTDLRWSKMRQSTRTAHIKKKKKKKKKKEMKLF